MTGGPVNPTGTPTDETVEEWYYDLRELASVVKANERRGRRNSRMTRVIALLTVFAVVLLGYRSEVNADRISRNAERAERANTAAEYQACVQGRGIIETYNAQQNELAAIDRDDVAEPPLIRARRIAARQRYQLRAPECRR